MARVITLQDRFDRGMIRDVPIDKLPAGGVWNLVDMIPDLDGAGLEKRGYWARHSESLSGSRCSALIVAPFATGPQLVSINSSGDVKNVDIAVGTVTAKGTAQVPASPPVFYRERVYIPSSEGTTSVKYYDGTNNAAAAPGAPPAGMFACAWKDHLVLARDATNFNRVWFSAGGDPTLWDTAVDGQWLDLTFVPTGLAVLRGMILAFSENAVERIRGDIIPGVAGSDILKETILNVGCPDPSSIATTDDYVVFANPNGVFLTDGIGLINLTEQCGIQNYYKETLFSAIFNFTGGIWNGHYVLSVYSGSTFIDAFVFDIDRRRCWRITNVLATQMASAPTTAEGAASGELFFGELGGPYVGRLSFMWIHASNFGPDGNGTYPSPSVTTGFLTPGGPGRKRWKKLHVNYVLEDSSGVDPAATVGWYFNRTLESTIATDTLPETTDAVAVTPRASIPISGGSPSDGISVRVQTAGTTSDFRLYSIEAEVQPQEQSK
jgi:hypothetical protein